MILMMFVAASVLAGEKKDRIVVGDVGFSTPESVEFYEAGDVYLVSNINGSPFAADGNGFISKLDPNGNIIDLAWIDGSKKGVTLNAPKGMAVVGENLFVADIDHVRIFELPSGRQIKSIAIDGSTFLNGITPGEGDCVYVTDSGYKEGFKPSGTDAVYKVCSDGTYETILRDENLGHPNGILEDDGSIIVVTLGSGEVFRIDASGKRTILSKPPTGGLDGLVKTKDDRIILSSWGGSAIYEMKNDGTFTVLADSLESPADLGVDLKRNRLLVPLFNKNEVVILPL